ncbi:pirin family protein [Chengkuizengella sp. 2205SS18-9]|uniref:Pirin family protein n=2 Tax=Chengkuizengella axinellae TaxID=3064388 RepID=A0ABT9IU56_9BACL|nr:pirin family protein [Chengkuizengella sp. 2205SS18-9]MDP5272818.1 pirin family protein [Chengkuizengella sp. 2205SS18-9]
MDIRIYKPADQGKGEFDGGKIKLQKPIGFPGEGSVINRLGPLFYFSWGKTEGEGGLGLHPHQGFEILTYVLKGRGYHRDSLNTESIVNVGGAQLMKAGSGISHAESHKEPSEILQIWFEPYLNEAIHREPTYTNYVHEDFGITKKNGVKIKTIIGENSPIELVTDAKMYDVTVSSGSSYQHSLSSNRTLAGLVIQGDGSVTSEETFQFKHKDFVNVHSSEDGNVSFKSEDEEVRIILIEIPSKVDYPLYKKRH